MRALRTLLSALAAGAALASCSWIHPVNAKAREASELLRLGRTGEAAALYAEAIAERSDDPVLKYDLGLAQYLREDFDAAADALQWALPRSEGSLRLLVLQALGNTRFRQGEYGKAIEAYAEGLRMQPENRDLKWNLELARRKLRSESGESKERLARDLRDRRVNAGRNTESGGRAPSLGADPWDLRHTPRSAGEAGADASGGGGAHTGLGGARGAASAYLEAVEESLRAAAAEGTPRPAWKPDGRGEPVW